MGTPKFNDDMPALAVSGTEDFYVRKRLQLAAKKELYAMENYRSETMASVKPPANLSQNENESMSDNKSAHHHNTAVIKSMDCRVKQIRPSIQGVSTGSILSTSG